MDDLISRQQAIDAVVSAMIDGADAELVEGVMELLPSAQPEIIRCKDCKYFTRDTITGVTIPGSEYCIFTMNNRIEEDDFCSRAERKEE